MAMVENATVTANATDLANTPFGKAWQEATGVELEIMQLADVDALNLLYASGELPDLIYSCGQRAKRACLHAHLATAAPILVLYPFLQKRFVKGVMVGAIKG